MGRAAAPLPHERPDDDRDGLTGRSLEERRLIERRIEQLRKGRLQADVRDDSIPKLRCSGCKRKRPAADFYWRADRQGYQSRCRACDRKKSRAYRQTAGGKAAVARRKETAEYRAYQAEWRRKRRAGLAGQPSTVRDRLMRSRRKARERLARMTDPERRAKTAALILNLTAEIDRIDRKY
jgi:hypothetical protein